MRLFVCFAASLGAWSIIGVLSHDHGPFMVTGNDNTTSDAEINSTEANFSTNIFITTVQPSLSTASSQTGQASNSVASSSSPSPSQTITQGKTTGATSPARNATSSSTGRTPSVSTPGSSNKLSVSIAIFLVCLLVSAA